METIGWDKFKETINSNIHSADIYLYRGHMSNQWPLTTTFHRYASKHNITLNTYLKDFLPNAAQHISSYTDRLYDTSNENDIAVLLSLLRHHGFPTPLIDWTRSPFVAAYFAFHAINNSQQKPARIYAFNYSKWKQIHQDKEDSKIINILQDTSRDNLCLCIPSTLHNTRAIPQQSVFTVTNCNDIKKMIDIIYAETLLTDKASCLKEYDLSAELRDKVMQELFAMNITAMTLFPGLDGICETLKENLFVSKQQKNILLDIYIKAMLLNDKLKKKGINETGIGHTQHE